MAQNAKDIQMRELKDFLNELRETNKLLRNALEETQKEKAVLQQERDNFKEQVDYLTKKLFGSFSEKGACDIPGQISPLMKLNLRWIPLPERLMCVLPLNRPNQNYQKIK